MSSKVLSLDTLLPIREQLKDARKTVVFTNGGFDLLHLGHVRYLQEARELGDVLIVGLNSDESMRQIKGPRRPLAPQGDRAEILAALGCVDYVVIFDELTPERVISLLRPDVHCKGGDYRPGSGKDIPEAEVVRAYGGRVEILPLLSGRSTTALIAAIVEKYGRGDS